MKMQNIYKLWQHSLRGVLHLNQMQRKMSQISSHLKRDNVADESVVARCQTQVNT